LIMKKKSRRNQKNSLIVFTGLYLVVAISISACVTGKRDLGKTSPVDLPEIKSLSIQYIGNKTEVVIEGERAIFYKAYKNPNLSRLMVEIPGFTLNKTIKPMRFESGAVTEILPREIQKGEPAVQFKIGLVPFTASSITSEGQKIIVEITPISMSNQKIGFSDEKVKSVSLQSKLQQPNSEKSFLPQPIGDQTEILPPDFIIGPEDVLEIMVWKNDVLSRTVTVRPDGKISFPLLGDVLVVGLKPNQVREKVTILLKEYMENPVVTVIVQQVNSYVVYMLGEVVNPGKYQLKSNVTLLQAMALAGGFTPFASKNKILVIRREYGKTSDTKIRIRYDDIVSSSKAENILLRPGDTILIP